MYGLEHIHTKYVLLRGAIVLSIGPGNLRRSRILFRCALVGTTLKTQLTLSLKDGAGRRDGSPSFRHQPPASLKVDAPPFLAIDRRASDISIDRHLGHELAFYPQTARRALTQSIGVFTRPFHGRSSTTDQGRRWTQSHQFGQVAEGIADRRPPQKPRDGA